jgi:hypothetical protein
MMYVATFFFGVIMGVFGLGLFVGPKVDRLRHALSYISEDSISHYEAREVASQAIEIDNG